MTGFRVALKNIRFKEDASGRVRIYPVLWRKRHCCCKRALCASHDSLRLHSALFGRELH